MFDELLVWLKEHPRVRYIGTEPDGSLVDEVRTFLKYQDGCLWFTRPNGEERFAPIQCGMVSASSSVRFTEEGFHHTKFGRTNTFLYDVREGGPPVCIDRTGQVLSGHHRSKKNKKGGEPCSGTGAAGSGSPSDR
jgi:hypothetical protein